MYFPEFVVAAPTQAVSAGVSSSYSDFDQKIFMGQHF
jgi:hypothetical protein